MSNEQHRIQFADILFQQAHFDDAYGVVDDILLDCDVLSCPEVAINALETLVQKHPLENGLWLRLMALINTCSMKMKSELSVSH